jgi:hypothetical protein
MKRSEMVNLIWQYIQEVERDYDRYMEEENASELLLKIEQAGMLPPPQTNKIIYDEKGPKHNEATRQWDDE